MRINNNLVDIKYYPYRDVETQKYVLIYSKVDNIRYLYADLLKKKWVQVGMHIEDKEDIDLTIKDIIVFFMSNMISRIQ